MQVSRLNDLHAFTSSLPPLTASPPPLPPTPAATLETLKNFHNSSSSLSLKIASTAEKLQLLSSVVKKNSIFMDDSKKVNGMVDEIKRDLESIHQTMSSLDSTLSSARTSIPSSTRDHSIAILSTLKTTVTTTATEFKQVLLTRSSSLKASSDRKKKFGRTGGLAERGKLQSLKTINLTQSTVSPTKLGVTHRGVGRVGEDGLVRPGIKSTNTNGSVDEVVYAVQYYNQTEGEGESSGHIMTPLEMQVMEEGEEQTQLLIPSGGEYLEQRAEAVSQIESSITELGGVFQKLAVMIGEHKELVERVEDNVEQAHGNVEGGMGQLMQTLEGLRSGRMLGIKITAVMVLFIIFFITFLA
mmetsp:Transcript_14076/g.25777  ORF Transcript_14076/g.25777 Transcript_14076/m.25777 type:complete len:356 (+) Transcript_14076:209-1276(+)|eukprot:CAMPEP_0182496422 /NCGR_PEP_ID=MMETSP1321-20130603/5071_1 /TAXON_ID=91990 /ORGANISM="Bolidomonas sp., Strain RCC1657" /LENGTH=355 /DNA_ID=CAMNT_0024700039 /DNA_START=125 /DNA_END=1192 /DNA_ORIENTATION=-